MKKKVDLRIIRTKKSIKEAFIGLLKEKNYNKITVQEIAEKAFINRNTFYLHYLDKDDLLGQLSDECLNNLKESMNANSEVSIIDNLGYEEFYEINKSVFKAIEDDFDFYKIILGDQSIPYLSFKFSNVIKNHMSEGLKRSYELKSNDVSIDHKIYIEYMASGLIGVIHFWINNKDKYSIEEVSKKVIDLYSKDILELLRKY